MNAHKKTLQANKLNNFLASGGDLSTICIFLNKLRLLDNVSSFENNFYRPSSLEHNLKFQAFGYLIQNSNSTQFRDNETWWETSECPMLVSEETRSEIMNSYNLSLYDYYES